MNLKEAFRYQNFLGSLMKQAADALTMASTAVTVTKTHRRKAANPDAEDVVEESDLSSAYEPNQVMNLMDNLVTEREKLSAAITKAKASAGFDLDAAQETNRFRHDMARAMRGLMSAKPGVSQDTGSHYKLTADGSQVSYRYQVEVETKTRFDRAAVRQRMKNILKTADETSARIDSVMVTTEVDYEPAFGLNDDFDEILGAANHPGQAT